MKKRNMYSRLPVQSMVKACLYMVHLELLAVVKMFTEGLHHWRRR